jgi:cytochrome c heme-lyase
MHASNSSSKYVITDDPSLPPASTSSSSSGASKPAPLSNQPNNDTLNPLNQMPNLTHDRAPNQKIDLPTSRTSSTIPRPPPASSSSATSNTTSSEFVDPSNPYNTSAHRDDTKVWEYPSPQQFYNALVRKGWETPEEHVETMVEIHNFLNEQAWEEVLDWEKTRRG